MSNARLRRSVAWALTGHDLALPTAQQWSASQLIDDLAMLGWTRDEIATNRDTFVRAWPHRVPEPLMEGLGAAQFLAALSEVRSRLGLDGLAPPTVPFRSALTADERRLLHDKPPHHG